MTGLSLRTASLLAALPLLSCSANSEQPRDPNPSGGSRPREEASRYAAPRAADDDFLTAFAETHRFRQGHPRNIEVLPDGSGVLFLRSPARSFEGKLYFFDTQTRRERELLSAGQLLGTSQEELTAEERARRERMRLTATGIASFVVSPDGAQILVPLSGKLFLVERALLGTAPNAVRQLGTGSGAAIDPRFSPDGSKVAFVRDGDLYVADVLTGVERRLTTRPGPHIENGLAEFVAQEEMGRMRGYWWSPDGASIAYQETDTSAVERMHILDPAHPEREPQSWPYPRPGAPNAAVRLGVISVAGGPTRWIASWDREAYPYLATARWSRGGLVMLVQSRDQHDEALLAIDPATLGARELLREHDGAWINLDQTVPHFRSEAAEWLWSTEREGFPQLELRTTSEAGSAVVRTLTEAQLGYRSVIAVDEEHGEVWVRAATDPTEGHVYRIPLGGGAPQRMTDERGEHDAVVGKNGELWVHIAQTLDGERATVRRRDGSEVGVLRSEAENPPFEPNLEFETAGAREWRTVLVRPRDFDETKRYPVIVQVYGGPHVRSVMATSDRYLLAQWQADHNFIVAIIDGRGTPGRGREWERAIDGDFISAPLADQVEALQALGARHPELDMERVGIWGWSFGGYFSAMAVLRRPDVFRAAIAGAPVSEWRDYDTHYTERYLGLPEAAGTAGAYHRSSVLTYATPAEPDEHRPLLIVHGTADDNVYFSHALKLQDALFRAGRPADLLALSGLTHMVPEAEITRRMHVRIMQFFEQHLRRAEVRGEAIHTERAPAPTGAASAEHT